MGAPSGRESEQAEESVLMPREKSALYPHQPGLTVSLARALLTSLFTSTT